ELVEEQDGIALARLLVVELHAVVGFDVRHRRSPQPCRLSNPPRILSTWPSFSRPSIEAQKACNAPFRPLVLQTAATIAGRGEHACDVVLFWLSRGRAWFAAVPGRCISCPRSVKAASLWR